MTTGVIGLVGDSPGFSIPGSLALLVREPASICVLTGKGYSPRSFFHRYTVHP